MFFVRMIYENAPRTFLSKRIKRLADVTNPIRRTAVLYVPIRINGFREIVRIR